MRARACWSDWLGSGRDAAAPGARAGESLIGRRRLAIAGLVALCVLAVAPLAAAEPDTVRVNGLAGPVEIRIDRWGIPHIYAETEEDLFFGQGFNAARDRLFQLEMWRRQVTGTMSEILGRRALKKDIGARLLKYRGDLAQELNHYHERGTTIFDAFVRGINAYLAEVERRPELLPLEFRLLGIKPGRWTPDVVVSRLNGLFGNVTAEVRNAQVLRVMNPETLVKLSDFRPPKPDLSDNGVDLSRITDDVIELYRQARAAAQFLPADIVAQDRAESTGRRLAVAANQEPGADWIEPGDGSNNWVISGRRTLSGKPILANDPHRALDIPPLRYVVHLVGGGWNAIGATEPTVPGVSMGHNQYGAWGLTIHGSDMEDLYVYDTNPSNPHQYRYRGRWEDMSIIRETVPVKGEGTVEVELKFTRHGPVLHEDREGRKAYALRAAWLDVGGAPYLADLRYGRAKNWQEWREGVTYHLAPSHNVVWADVHGDIGWQVAHFAPIRRNWSGLLPVPGDGRFEWDGYLPVKELPHVQNPPAGFFASANEYNVPEGYPYVYNYDYSEPFRSARIHELLGSSLQRYTVQDMHEIQHDWFSIPARTLLPLLLRLDSSDRDVRRALETLRSWDLVLNPNSAPAAIYVAWERRLRQAVSSVYIPPEARGLMSNVPLVRVMDFLTSPDGRFGQDPVAGRNALLLRSLAEALADLRQRLGPDMSGWRYGQPNYHYVRTVHVLSGDVNPEIRRKLDVGPAPRGGSGYTVNPTGYGDNQTSGPSYRIIADASNWDNSVGITTPGQSGDPDSPHYRDLFEHWLAGRHIPFAFSREKVESVTERVVLLTPAPRAGPGER